MWRDFTYALRGLWRTPVFTAAATLALGLAIGANATIFGVVDGLWFRPPGVAHPDTIVRIFSTTRDDAAGAWSYPEFLALRDARSFAGIAARGRRGTFLANAAGTPELVLVNVVSTNFFSMLGVRAGVGRVFEPGDEISLAETPAVVLGHAFWVRRFAADPSIVGRTIHLSGGGAVPVVVMGVLPAAFRDLDPAADRDVWMPPQTWERLAGRSEFEARDERWFELVGRRRPGVSVAAAQAEVSALAASLASSFPSTNRGRGSRVISDFAWRYENGGTNAAALVGLVLLVVLITCVNVANLLIARGTARAPEVAVRAAIGASRARLVRQLMVESLALGACGAVVGLLLALWLLRLVPALLVAPPGFRSFSVFQADGRVLAFTVATTILTTLLFGVAPSVFATRVDLIAIAKGGGSLDASSRSGRVLRDVLVVAQIAVSLVLLSGAAVLARSFLATERADIGVTRRPVLTAWISGTDVRRPEIDTALRAIRALPGVREAGYAFRAPLSLSGGGLAMPMVPPGASPAPGEALPDVKFNPVSTGYFAAIGTALVRGRLFSDADETAGEPVVIVNEAFERRFFPDHDAPGAFVRMGRDVQTPFRIVGVVHDAVVNEIGEAGEPYFYVPFWRRPMGEVTFLVQTSGDASALASPVRDALKRVNPALEPARVTTMQEYIAYSASTYRATASLAALLGLIGLILTALGVYGVVAYRMSRRTREIGIRIALGAHPPDVLRLVMREGARVAVLGIALGLPIALGATRLLSSLLFRVSAWDAWSFAAAAVALAVAVCAATAVPAWRAARLPPSIALRET